MRRSAPLLLAVALLSATAAAQAQDTRLRGLFAPMLPPSAETRPPTGEVRAIVEDDGDVRVDLVVSGLTDVSTSATLHTGRVGQLGEEVARMDVALDGADGRVIGATAALGPTVAAQVRSGDAYVVVRTLEHPDGILRAQLAPQVRTLESVVTEDSSSR